MVIDIMTELNYKVKPNTKWDISIEKNDMSLYHWEAHSNHGDIVADREGGELGNVSNAKVQIKEWLKDYTWNPRHFITQYPYLVKKSHIFGRVGCKYGEEFNFKTEKCVKRK